MGLVQVTAPTIEPIGLQEAKDHLRVDSTTEDPLISALISAARQQAEDFTWRQLVTATYDWTLDAFPWCLRPPKPPLQGITSITYLDTAGASQVLASTEYTVDAASQPGRVAPAFGKTWPSTQAELNAVTVRLVVGYGDGASHVPAPIKQAILMAITDFYENRQSTVIGLTAIELPQTAKSLLRPYVVEEL